MDTPLDKMTNKSSASWLLRIKAWYNSLIINPYIWTLKFQIFKYAKLAFHQYQAWVKLPPPWESSIIACSHQLHNINMIHSKIGNKSKGFYSASSLTCEYSPSSIGELSLALLYFSTWSSWLPDWIIQYLCAFYALCISLISIQTVPEQEFIWFCSLQHSKHLKTVLATSQALNKLFLNEWICNRT